MPRKRQAIDFEKALAELELQVQRLESGDLPLEDALQAFEKGVRLSRDCQQALAEAEQKVKLLLTAPDGSTSIEDFGADDDDHGR